MNPSNQFQCLFCEQRFPSRIRLDAHMDLHTSERPYFCGICNLACLTQHALHCHCEAVHSNIPTKTVRNGKHILRVDKVEVNKVPLADSVMMTEGKERMPTSQNFALTSSEMETISSGELPNVVPKPTNSSSMIYDHSSTRNVMQPIKNNAMETCADKSTDELYDCLFCGKLFSSYSKLESHMTTHTRERPYFCRNNGCKKSWSTADALYRHNQSAHTRIKYRCSACFRIFRNYNCFCKHRRDDHNGKSKMENGMHTIKGEIVKSCISNSSHLKLKINLAALREQANKKTRPVRGIGGINKKRMPAKKTIAKPFDCIFCGKSFREMRQLEMHMNTHTGERPYVCTKCDSYWSCRYSLYKHGRKVHMNTGRQPRSKFAMPECKNLDNISALAVSDEEQKFAADDVNCSANENFADEDPLSNDATLLYDVAKWVVSITGDQINPADEIDDIHQRSCSEKENSKDKVDGVEKNGLAGDGENMSSTPATLAETREAAEVMGNEMIGSNQAVGSRVLGNADWNESFFLHLNRYVPGT